MNISGGVTGSTTAYTSTYTSYVDDTNAAFGTGITVGTATGDGVVTGLGPANDAHGFSMTNVESITLAAGAGTFNNDFSLQVAPYAPLSLNCQSATTGKVGSAYSSLLTANGGVAPYAFSIISGSISPLLLTASGANAGLISGTPTVAGTLSFTAQVVDSSGNTGTNTVTKACSIVVG
jgi:hypothetical protein